MTDGGRSWGPIGVDQWIQGAAALGLEQRGPQVWLVGPCPGCGHELARDITAAIGVGLVDGAALDRLSITCNCGQVHAGRAADARPAGCGAAGSVQIVTR
ncbi:hypothetical protein OMK64_06585 [Cellulomonas fimi]|uniref:hypothetical protein n=1 Tax=Cellulomonas fimi TaxID=1708 RepID=UPI00234CD8A3|nr:hypothetical protein [Cellulomonas fimi]MDC7121198.1 hypothetical protein [Cellulomonas fimi]